ncbi:hypothetical protein ACQP1G_23870 [Nocardia sp. CA-107356]|uniref:hypothetical protein n=1 Tax=Nocardia sp. CA-107356 TaxID=3239972 RepID=UPI003D930B5B
MTTTTTYPVEKLFDPDLQKQLREILNGKGSLRDLAQSESFIRLSDAVLPKVAADLGRRTPEEIQRLAEKGKTILESYRNEEPDAAAGPATDQQSVVPRSQPSSALATPSNSAPEPPSGSGPGPAHNVIPGTRKPDRDRIVMPDEPDDDDLYYEDRRRRGWLE